MYENTNINDPRDLLGQTLYFMDTITEEEIECKVVLVELEESGDAFIYLVAADEVLNTNYDERLGYFYTIFTWRRMIENKDTVYTK